MEANIGATATMSADEYKNSFLYTPQRRNAATLMVEGGLYPDGAPAVLIEAFYQETKAAFVMSRLPGFTKWLLAARSNFGSTKHVHLSTLLWSLFGPKRLAAKMARFTKKFKAGEYADVYVAPSWGDPEDWQFRG